ncbi:porin [Anatilimnocola floriformis]|uniref:porin n=1 Tax=Anatilimnocola floriformis TaxID=2948575 RepID=UPI0020C498BB|nr:porin [Anatilimnocola floriformis]
MKLSKLAFAMAIAWGIYTGNASAQTYGQQPVRQVSNDYFYQPEQSPSDKPPPAPMVETPMAPAAAAVAEAPAEEEATCDPWHLFCQKECGWNLYGFVNGGITGNPDSPPSRYNGPVTFNDRNEAMLNQFYAIGEKKIDRESCCWNWGGRIDVLYGTDYIFTQSNGWETDLAGAPKWNGSPFYGLAIPQLYAEVGNVNNSIKIGHFYTPIGYEVVPANGNFFYSHAYTMQYGEPFTHWGALGAYKWSDEITLNYGLVNGWDAFNRVRDDASVIAGFVWTGEQDTLAFNIIYGNEPVADDVTVYTKRYMHSLVYTYNINTCWQYIFQHDYASQLNANRGQALSAEWYGINQYLFYKINDCWKAGIRGEWFRDDDGVRVTGLRPDAGNPILGQGFAGNFYDVAVGLNWTPSANLTVRGEIRYDKFDGVSPTTPGLEPYGDGTRSDQTLFALDFIYLW